MGRVNKMKKKISISIAILMIAICIIPSTIISNVDAAEKSKDISILFTGDMHDHLDKLAKIKTLKKEADEKYDSSFLFDAGDFSMGTPTETIFESDAPELKTMAEAGFDATTLGNHEFDYQAPGLAKMLNTAAKYDSKEYTLPAIVASNINWTKTLSDKDTKVNGEKLKSAFENYGVEDYTIIEKGGVKIAVFGVMGDEAISQAPEAKVYFTDYIKRAEKIVKEIKANGEADLIVCLSHSGINTEDFDASEDVALAKEVDGIDLIVSGHSHNLLDNYKEVNGTIIGACGEYNNNIGQVVLEKSGDKYKVKSYDLTQLNGDVKDDQGIKSKVAGFKSDVNKEFFSKYGYSYDETLAKSNYDFTPIKDFGKKQGEDTLGNLISDSFIYAVEKNDSKSTKPVDVAIVPAGTVRASFTKGDITTVDAFDVCALGMGADGTPGYPLVNIYLTGKELKTVAEVDASISPSMNVARLYMSGIGYTINDHRLFLNRATDIKLVDKNGKEKADLDNSKLYRVVGGLYSCQMLSLVKEQSHGLLSIEPKNAKGEIIKDFNKYIIKDKDGGELKEWDALASYIKSFKGDKVPAYYGTTHDRKIIDNSFNPIKLIKQPNNIAIMLLGIILIPVVIIVGIIIYIIKRRNARRGFAGKMFSGSRNKRYTTMSSRGRKPNVRHRNLNVRGNKRRKRRRF